MKHRTPIAMIAAAMLFSGCAVQQAAYLDYAPNRGVDLPAPPPDKARVIFFLWVARTGENLVLYDGDERFGVIRYVTWTSRLVAPGEHRFGVVSLENADFTVGNLEGGKTYLLEAQSIFPTYRFRLEPVGPADTHTGTSIEQVLASLYRVQPNAQLGPWMQRHGARVQSLYDRYYEKWLTKPEGDRRTISPKLGIEGPIRYSPPDAS